MGNQSRYSHTVILQSARRTGLFDDTKLPITLAWTTIASFSVSRINQYGRSLSQG